MTVSGIVMACRPEHVGETTKAVNALPWAEVHYTDPGGRLVVTIEAEDVEESVGRLVELQGLPRVLMAELAEFVVEDAEDSVSEGTRTTSLFRSAESLRDASWGERNGVLGDRTSGGDDGPDPT